MRNESLESQLQLLDEKLAVSVEHKKREAQFAGEANIRFEKNINCFRKYYPDIANLGPPSKEPTLHARK